MRLRGALDGNVDKKQIEYLFNIERPVAGGETLIENHVATHRKLDNLNYWDGDNNYDHANENNGEWYSRWYENFSDNHRTGSNSVNNKYFSENNDDLAEMSYQSSTNSTRAHQTPLMIITQISGLVLIVALSVKLVWPTFISAYNKWSTDGSSSNDEEESHVGHYEKFGPETASSFSRKKSSALHRKSSSRGQRSESRTAKNPLSNDCVPENDIELSNREYQTGRSSSALRARDFERSKSFTRHSSLRKQRSKLNTGLFIDDNDDSDLENDRSISPQVKRDYGGSRSFSRRSSLRNQSSELNYSLDDIETIESNREYIQERVRSRSFSPPRSKGRSSSRRRSSMI